MSLSVKSLSKTYGSQKAVNAVSFEAKEGEILGFLGPNGAGKSTTMKVATCYITPTEGTVEVCGFDVQKNPIEVRKNIGYLPEHNPLYLDMYVHEYLIFASSLHGITGRKAKQRVAEVVKMVGLTKEQNKLIGDLSKGYRQRVGLAQTLLHDPKVLILDEPTTGLDPNQIAEIRQVIRNVSRNKTVVFSTHIMQEVQALCDRVIIIRDGEIVANDVIERLDQKEGFSVRVVFEEVPASFASLEKIEGFQRIESSEEGITIRSSRDIRAELFRMAVENGWVLLEMTPQKASLEGIFKELTTR